MTSLKKFHNITDSLIEAALAVHTETNKKIDEQIMDLLEQGATPKFINAKVSGASMDRIQKVLEGKDYEDRQAEKQRDKDRRGAKNDKKKAKDSVSEDTEDKKKIDEVLNAKAALDKTRKGFESSKLKNAAASSHSTSSSAGTTGTVASESIDLNVKAGFKGAVGRSIKRGEVNLSKKKDRREISRRYKVMDSDPALQDPNHKPKLPESIDDNFEAFLSETSVRAADEKRYYVRGPNGKMVWRNTKARVRIMPKDYSDLQTKPEDDPTDPRNIKYKSVASEALIRHYHSVFYKSKEPGSKWGHHFDADTKEDAGHEIESIRNQGHKAVRLTVPKAEAKNWSKVDVHNYVEQRLATKKTANEDFQGDENEPEADKHILMQMRKAAIMGGHKEVTFKNGEKVKIHPHHASTFVTKYMNAKPNEKEHMQNHGASSHANFLSTI